MFIYSVAILAKARFLLGLASSGLTSWTAGTSGHRWMRALAPLAAFCLAAARHLGAHFVPGAELIMIGGGASGG